MSVGIENAAVMLLNLPAYLITALFLIFGPGRAYGYDKLLKRILL